MTTTTHLGIMLVEQSQAQKEVTVNAALTRIDAILNNGAKSRTTNTPPGSPASGDLYIVGSTPTSAWTGQGGKITYYDQAWQFIAPGAGMTLWVNDESKLYSYDGSSWTAFTGGGGSGTPGGTNGQVQYNSAGSFGGFTMGGDATLNTSTGAITIASSAITNAKMANMAGNTVKINNTGSSAAPTDVALSASQLLGRGSSGNVAAIALGSGLTMSGTTLDSLIDVYVQGTFSPTLKGSSTAGTFTYTEQKGYYTRIGNRVDFNLVVQFSGYTGSPAGRLEVLGLPYTDNNGSGLPTFYTVAGTAFSAGSGNIPVAVTLDGGTTIDAYGMSPTTGVFADSTINSSSSRYICVAGTYYTTQSP